MKKSWWVPGTFVLLGLLFLTARAPARSSTATSVTSVAKTLPVSPTPTPTPTPASVVSDQAETLLVNPAAPSLPRLDPPLVVQAAGVTVRLDALDTQGMAQGQAEAQVCFTLPSSSPDWMLGEAWLETSAGRWPLTGAVLVRYEKDAAGTVWRCETATFAAPAAVTAPVYLTRLVVASLLGPRAEQPDCAAIQQALAPEGIRVAPLADEGMGGCQVVEHPAGMSRQEAEERLAALLLPQREGPWVFDLPSR